MAKINPAKKIQKRRTEAEMRDALTGWHTGSVEHLHIPPEMNDTDIILQDCIEELLESRATIEEIKAFVQSWSAKFARK